MEVDEEIILREVELNDLPLLAQEIPILRDVLQLYIQLKPLLPINEPNDLNKVEGMAIDFRDLRIPVNTFQEAIPQFIFPVDNSESLIRRLYQVVQLVDPLWGYSSTNKQNIQMLSDRNFAAFFKQWASRFGLLPEKYIIE